MVVLNQEKIMEILTYTKKSSTFWKERIGDKEFKEIPVLKKGDLPGIQKEALPFGGISTIDIQQMARIFMSPGPIYDPQSEDGDFWRFAEALETAGFNERDIVQNTFSYHLSPAGFMFDSALRKLGATVIPAGIGNTELQVQIMKDLLVSGFVGTPSFLNILLNKAEEMGYEFGKDIVLKKAFFTAEKLSLSLRKEYENKGINVFEGYGTADVGNIAYQDGKNEGLKVSSSVQLELLDPYTDLPIKQGDIGQVVVTTFDKSYPLIRFGTGDLSSWVDGKEGEYITGVLGRVGDGVKVKGMFVHLKQISNILDEIEEILYYQAIVDRVDNQDLFTIHIEANDKNIEPEAITARLKETIRVTPFIKLVPKDSISRVEQRLVDKRKWD